MDKNLVNIDDLFRQRLGGGEAEEKAGAWMNMRELLDKEMPLRPVAGVRWRRMLSYTAGLLLLAFAALGSYEALTAQRTPDHTSTSNIVSTAGSNANPKNINSTLSGNTEGAQTVPSQHNDNNGTTPTPVTNDATVAVITPNDHHRHITKDATIGVKTTHTVGKPELAISNTAQKTIATQKSTSASKVKTLTSGSTTKTNNIVAINKTNQQNVTQSSTSQQSVVARNTQLKKTYSNAHLVALINKSKIKSTKRNNTNAKRNIASNVLAASVHQSPGVASLDNTVATTSKVLIEKQKINKIEVVQRYISKPGNREGHLKNDTVDRGEVTIDRASTKTSQSMTSKSNMSEKLATSSVNARKNKVAENKDVLLASIANQEVKGKPENESTATHSSRKSTTLANFAEMVRDLKENLGNVKFSPGITGGINGTFFSLNSFTGFQLGFTGNFIFNDRWSIMTEIKYLSRFAGNSILNDNYVNYTPLGNGTYQRDSAQHYFKYNNLQSFELPFMLTNTRGKYNFFVGGNLVYDFAINNDFVNNPISGITSEPARNIKPRFTEDDFSSRFGFGYVLGVGYEITPLLHGDVRMVQTIWDNAKTNGAQALSKEFYKTPSIQFSIGYTIKKKENRMP